MVRIVLMIDEILMSMYYDVFLLDFFGCVFYDKFLKWVFRFFDI